ncbi:MAG: sulfatase [Cyclobacteriaceae bacterium]
MNISKFKTYLVLLISVFVLSIGCGKSESVIKKSQDDTEVEETDTEEEQEEENEEEEEGEEEEEEEEEEEPSDRLGPNLLIIQTDEHNFRTLGCYRNTLSAEQAFIWGPNSFVETPNIDKLAENGALFTKYYAATPVCSPSRGTFVSGLYPHQNNVTRNDRPLNGDITTFSQVLSDKGYSTGFIGKWHLDGDGKPQWAPERKFGFDDNRYMFNRGHWKKLEDTENGPKVPTGDYSLAGADEESYTTDFLTNRAIDFMTEHKSESFSLYLSIPDPHGPDEVRAPYDQMYTDMTFDKPRNFASNSATAPAWAKPDNNPKLTHDQYFGMVRLIDDNVGKIVAFLTENNLLENTIIVFTSDHGDLRAEHGRHNKGNPLEASAKIPFIVHYPAGVPKGSIVNNALNTVDFAPTILNFMQQSVPAEMVGKDFSGLLTDPATQSQFEDITFLRSSSDKWIAAVTSRYKLVLSPIEDPWLFDLEQDPDELTNYVNEASKASVIKELAQKLKDYGEAQSDPYLATGTKVRNELEDLL